MDAPWGVAPSSARYRDRQSIAGWPITWPMTGKELDMEHQQGWFVGIDWGSQDHQVHVSDAAGVRLGARSFPHDGAGLAAMAEWILGHGRAAGGSSGGDRDPAWTGGGKPAGAGH